MNALANIFGSPDKFKVIKLFLFNPELAFDVGELSRRAKISREKAAQEIRFLDKAGLIKQKVYLKDIWRQKNRKMVQSKKKAGGWILDYKFKHLEALYNFFGDIGTFDQDDLVDKLSKSIKPQLLIVSGFFIKEADSRVDLFIVGENIKQAELDQTISIIESEIGKEIKYCILETSEFKYRLSVFDKLIRDVLDYPHRKLVNKLGV